MCARVVQFASIVALLLAAHLLLVDRTVGADESLPEDRIKAAYLFNFLRFVEWPGGTPADPPGQWVIGVIGDSSVSGELKWLAEGKTVEGRALLVRKFRAKDDPRGCNILFISASAEKHFPAILSELRDTSVLTVGDFDHFIGQGGMIQFVTEGGRVRMDIDVGATGRAHLKVSSKLLALALAVTETVRSGRK